MPSAERRAPIRPRVHVLAHANPIHKDIERFEFANLRDYLQFIRDHLPRAWRLTCSRRLLQASEDPLRAGRRDDALRVRDLQGALDDPATVAIVALAGGGWFTRIVPHVDFDTLRTRRARLFAFGFSEMTSLVNFVARYRCGRGIYWLGPNYLAWKVRPASAARSAFGAFWRSLPARCGQVSAGRDWSAPPDRVGDAMADPLEACSGPVPCVVVRGRVRSERVRFVGGCLSILAAILANPKVQRWRPNGCWLLLEDINEPPYRVDRYLATLRHAGWLDRVAGVLVGDFHSRDVNDQPATIELLKVQLSRATPILRTSVLGHVWPMAPLMLNQPLMMTVRGKRATIESGR